MIRLGHALVPLLFLSLSCGESAEEPLAIEHLHEAEGATDEELAAEHAQATEQVAAEQAQATEQVGTEEVAAEGTEAEPFAVHEVGGALEQNAEIIVHVRKTHAVSSFAVQETFTQTVTLRAIDSAVGPALSSSVLWTTIQPLLADGETLREARLRVPEAGQGMPLATATIAVNDDGTFYTDGYIASDAAGARHIFVDMFLE